MPSRSESSRIWIRSSGAPTFLRPLRIILTVSAVHWNARELALKMTALRPLRMPTALPPQVAVGLVAGRMAQTTPTGLAYFEMPLASSRSISPTLTAPLMSCMTPPTLRLCLRILLSALP